MASIRIRAVLQLARLRTLYAYRHGDWRKLTRVQLNIQQSTLFFSTRF